MLKFCKYFCRGRRCGSAVKWWKMRK
jgi:hypothetical protein